MPFTRLIEGSVTLQHAGQATPVGVSPFSSGRCTMKISGCSFALTQLPVGETAEIDGHIQRIKRVEGACATLSKD